MAKLDKKVPKTAVIRQTIKSEISLQRIEQDLLKWRNALISAENIINPYRTELYRLYKDVELDAHITAVWNARKTEIMGTEFIVYKNGKIQQKQTDFIQRKWFFDFLNYALDSKMWGFSLIQFGNILDNEFTDIDLVPRAYVRPELNLVVPMYGAMAGEDFTKKPYTDWLIPVGGKTDLGLLAKLGPLYLWKKTALETWAMYCQIFGIPARVLKTDTSDEIALRNGQRMVKEMGASLGAVIDTDDEFEIIESKGANAGETFSGLINVCNFEISKLLLGETSSMDPKAFVGSSKIHEKTKNQMILADIIWLENIFKYQLIPFLNAHDLGFEGCNIKIENDQQLTLQEKSDIINNLLQYYDIPSEYIMDEFGIPVLAREKVLPENQVTDNYLQEGLGSTATEKDAPEDTHLSDSPIRQGWVDELNKKIQD